MGFRHGKNVGSLQGYLLGGGMDGKQHQLPPVLLLIVMNINFETAPQIAGALLFFIEHFQHIAIRQPKYNILAFMNAFPCEGGNPVVHDLCIVLLNMISFF